MAGAAPLRLVWRRFHQFDRYAPRCWPRAGSEHLCSSCAFRRPEQLDRAGDLDALGIAGATRAMAPEATGGPELGPGRALLRRTRHRPAALQMLLDLRQRAASRQHRRGGAGIAAAFSQQPAADHRRPSPISAATACSGTCSPPPAPAAPCTDRPASDDERPSGDADGRGGSAPASRGAGGSARSRLDRRRQLWRSRWACRRRVSPRAPARCSSTLRASRILPSPGGRSPRGRCCRPCSSLGRARSRRRSQGRRCSAVARRRRGRHSDAEAGAGRCWLWSAASRR